MERLERPGDRPAHPDRRGDVVERLLAHDSLRYEVHGLAEQRGLQTVRDESRRLAIEYLWSLADRPVEGDRPVDDRGVGSVRRHDLDGRDEVRRIERMTDH